MFRLLVLTLWLLSTALAATKPLPRGSGRIIGGTDTSISQYPWQLSFQYSGSHHCGASIISSNWVLTAAHCLYNRYVNLMSFRAGSSTRGSGGYVLNGENGYLHGYFSMEVGDYDVGVVQVSGSFPLGSNVQIVNLAADGYDPPGGLPVTITGWGYTYTGGGSPINLQKVDISIIDRASCQSRFGATARMICAGEAGRSVCNGDSGGPLVNGNVQVGIVSWGRDVCEIDGAVYSSVGSLRSWIRQTSGV